MLLTTQQGIIVTFLVFRQHKRDSQTKRQQTLACLHSAMTVDDMDIPGYRLHELKGKLKGLWAIDISKNWRIVFRFEEGDAYIVNYEDYH